MREYISDMWNVVDFITNSLYVATIALRITAYYDVSFILYKVAGFASSLILHKDLNDQR
jgi:transient receptor potential cation channel subfamily C